MTTHTNLTTSDIKNGTHNLTFQENDTIITNGFYVPGDGGGAEFTVQSGTAENSYFEYTLVNNETTQLKAVMVIKDGIVNVDQLGAKGDYPDTVTFDSYLSSRNKTFSGATLDDVYAYGQSIVVNAPTTIPDNSTIINEAIKHSDVTEVRFSAGKRYGISDPIEVLSNKIINGCGAVILPFAERGNGRLINIENKSDVEVKNLHLFHALTTDVKRTHNKCFYIKDCNNVSVHDVFMENTNYGMDISGTCEHIFLKNLHIERVLAGIEYTNISDSFLKDSYISCDYNLLYSPTIKEEIDAANRHHCVYIAATTRNCTFKNLTLLNAGYGNAINRNYADIFLEYDEFENGAYPDIPLYPLSENLLFENIIIDNCDVAVLLGKRSKNVMVKNIVATNICQAGIHLNGVENIIVKNSSFFGKEGANDAYAIFTPSNKITVTSNNASKSYRDINNYYLTNVTISNCNFDFYRHFIGTGLSRETENDELTVNNCNFYIHTLDVLGNTDNPDDNSCMPSQIKGTIAHAMFKNCRFEYNPVGEISKNVQCNGTFFFLRSDRAKKMLWEFDKCSFINNGSYTINSPITDRLYSNYIFVSISNCTVKGFRFILRKANIMPYDDNKEYDSTYLPDNNKMDPAWIGIPSEAMVSDAVNSLNNNGKYHSQKNIYLRTPTDSNDTYYMKAEEFGL